MRNTLAGRKFQTIAIGPRKGISSIPLKAKRAVSVQFTFEFDEAKSQANLLKHGIDFVEAQALWQDGNLLRIAARVVGEARFIVIGMIASKHWSAITTPRGEAIRLISVRRSRPREVEIYEGQ